MQKKNTINRVLCVQHDRLSVERVCVYLCAACMSIHIYFMAKISVRCVSRVYIWMKRADKTQ